MLLLNGHSNRLTRRPYLASAVPILLLCLTVSGGLPLAQGFVNAPIAPTRRSHSASSSSHTVQTVKTEQDVDFQPDENGWERNYEENIAAAAAAAELQKQQNPNRQKQTLYDILRANPTDSREILKRQYLKMARQTHPDALISQGINGDSSEFAEIAAAWRVLSDPKQRLQYDRSLQAEAFTDDVERYATNFASGMGNAGPTAKRVLEQIVSIPFLKKTAATTAASFRTLSERMGNGTATADIGGAVMSAVRAARQAGIEVDRMELEKKYEELQKRVADETAKAERLEVALQGVREKRMQVILKTPNIGLSSAEARDILERIEHVETAPIENRANDPAAPLDRAMQKHSAQEEIRALLDAEASLNATRLARDKAETARRLVIDEIKEAEEVVEEALAAERKARKALELAQQRLESKRRMVESTIDKLSTAEMRKRSAIAEVDQISKYMAAQQEKVRVTLYQTYNSVKKPYVAYEAFADIANGPMNSSAKIKKLEMKEKNLASELTRQKIVRDKVWARTMKLKQRAESLARLHQPGNVNGQQRKGNVNGSG